MTEHQQITWGFVQVGLTVITSAICKHQLKFQLDEYLSVLALNFNKKINPGSGSKQTEFYFPTCTKPCSLSATISNYQNSYGTNANFKICNFQRNACQSEKTR